MSASYLSLLPSPADANVQRYPDTELALADVCAEVSAVCILYPGTEGDLQLVQSVMAVLRGKYTRHACVW